MAGERGEFAAFLTSTDIPASARKEAIESLGGRLDIARNISDLVWWGIDVLLKVNGMGRYVLNVVPFGNKEWAAVGKGST